MDAFARVNAGVTSPAEFFSQENVERILGSGGQFGLRPQFPLVSDQRAGIQRR